LKPTRSIIKILITLVVLTAAAVPASQFYKTTVMNAEAVQSAAVPLPIPSTGDTSRNFAAELIPYQAKPWLEPAARQGFRADAIPYQAKPWLELAARQSFRADAIPYQAKPWLEPAARQGFRADAIPYQAKPWLEPAARQGFRADAIPYQAKPWLELEVGR
jgi:hypothetical protein